MRILLLTLLMAIGIMGQSQIFWLPGQLPFPLSKDYLTKNNIRSLTFECYTTYPDRKPKRFEKFELLFDSLGNYVGSNYYTSSIFNPRLHNESGYKRRQLAATSRKNENDEEEVATPQVELFTDNNKIGEYDDYQFDRSKNLTRVVHREKYAPGVYSFFWQADIEYDAHHYPLQIEYQEGTAMASLPPDTIHRKEFVYCYFTEKNQLKSIRSAYCDSPEGTYELRIEVEYEGALISRIYNPIHPANLNPQWEIIVTTERNNFGDK